MINWSKIKFDEAYRRVRDRMAYPGEKPKILCEEENFKMRSEVEVKFKKLHPDVQLPTFAHEGDSGMDVRAFIDKDVSLYPGQSFMVPTGLSVEVPIGYEIQVRPRSGLAAKSDITVLNSPGTIDSRFRGECKVILINHSKKLFTIHPNDRIAQFVVCELPKVRIVEVDELSETDRGAGFGSSGVK